MTALPPCAIFDVDGTLADVSGVRHYLADPRRKNYEAFHGASAFVPPHRPIVTLAQALHESGVAVVVVTARMEKWRFMTSQWLRKWDVPRDALYMRRDGDGRKDFVVKREILEFIRSMWTPILAVDDNPAIIELWNSESIPVVTWPGWEYDEAHPPPAS